MIPVEEEGAAEATGPGGEGTAPQETFSQGGRTGLAQ